MNKRNYELTLNVTTGKIKIPSISIYNTDKGIFNIKLFLEKGEGKNTVKLTHDEMVNYKALFQAVKSKTKNYVELEGILDETENFFYYDLGSKFNDQVGVYNCQMFITDTNGTNDNETDDEVVTSVPFNYTVMASILTGLNSEIKANPDLPVLKELINECKILMNLDSADMSVLDPFQTKVDNTLTTTEKEIPKAINEVSSQINTKANFSDVAKISNGTPLFASSVNEMIDISKNYVNTTDGYLYVYNGNTFISSGVKYQETGVSDYSISKNKFNFAHKTRNMCNVKLEQGSFWSNGTDKADELNVRSDDFIQVTPSSTLCFSRYSNKTIGKMFIFGYDENKGNGIQITTITNGVDATYNSRVIPENVYYIKFYDSTNDLNMKIQIEEGSTYTDFIEPYVMETTYDDMPLSVKTGIKNIEDISLSHSNFLKKSAKTSLLTWIDDDVEVSKIPIVKQICDDLSIKCSFGCITNKLLTIEGLTDLLLSYQDEGFHITTHSHLHSYIWNYQQPEYSISECEKDLIKSLQTMRENGFLNYDYLIAPFGANQSDIRHIIARYCKCNINAYTDARYNHLYGDGRYNINRIFIIKTNTLDFYKNIIDTSVINGDWIIFGTHSNNPTEFDETLVRDIMTYAKSKMEILNLKQAWDKRKYVYDICDMYM